MRAAFVGCCLVLLGCRATDARRPDATDSGRPDGYCCPIDQEASCECTSLGGRALPGVWCPNICDSVPINWERGVDDGGCPYWVPNGMGCPMPPSPDAG
jgi:hypothetical protein